MGNEAASEETAPGRVGALSTFETAEVEAAVRRYLGRLTRRYTPVALGLAAVLLVTLLVPTVSPVGGGASGVGSVGAASGRSGSSGAPSAGAAHGGSGGTTVGNSGGVPAAAPAGAAGSIGSGSEGSSGASGPVATPSSTGVSVSGVTCGPGVPQVRWTPYSPSCVAAFHGANGGATSHGVTASAITISVRISNSGEAAVIGSAEPFIQKGAGTPQQSIQDMKTYTDFFNKQFELYGRKVVIAPYTGQGDYLEEDQGQDLAAAQSDAATAYANGAFGDMSLLFTTQPYDQDLAQEHVIALGGVYFPQSWFQQYSPYGYSSFQSGTKSAKETVDALCQRMAGLPAAWAGDPLYQHQNRVFGVVTPENPIYLDNASVIENGLKACGAAPARVVQYSFNFATAANQATSVVAQLKAAGVTTVVCLCDPLIPVFLTQSADQQQYRPEWEIQWWNDEYDQSFSSDQWSHALAVGNGQYPATSNDEALRVFRMASNGANPAEDDYSLVYVSLLQLFNALQAAGPDLNPSTFQRGMFSLPASPGAGEFGVWRYGNGAFTPGISYKVSWWNPKATSAFDGSAGAWIDCNGGAWYPYDQAAAIGPRGRQLACFGG